MKETRPQPERRGAKRPAPGSPVTSALRWAIDAKTDPAVAAADWLATDIDPKRQSAADLLTSPGITLLQLKKAKNAYKAMRIIGETPADRRIGARLYAAAIAAGLVWHGRRISAQSDAALGRAFRGLLDDPRMDGALRTMAGKALCLLDQRNPDGTYGDDAKAIRPDPEDNGA